MLISIWGKNGSGKSTVASNLACAFAKRGLKTAVVGANRFYGAIQYYFNMVVKTEQSLRAMLSGGDSLSIKDYFLECPYEKNIHIASLADADDCAGYNKMRIDLIVRFINLIKKEYPVVLIDSDESVEDPLSMYSLTLSEHIVYVTRPALQSVIFAKAYESIITGLQIKELIKTVFIGAAGDPALYAPFGAGGNYRVLPRCAEIENAQGGSLPVLLTRSASRQVLRYRRAIYEFADSLLDNPANAGPAAGIGIGIETDTGNGIENKNGNETGSEIGSGIENENVIENESGNGIE